MNQNVFYFFQGIRLINSLIDEYGLDVVQAYMKHIQVNKLPVQAYMKHIQVNKLPVVIKR